MEHQTDPDYLRQQVYNNAYDLDVRTHILTHYLADGPDWYSWLFDQLRLPEESRILELGCGPGDLWQQKPPACLPGGLVCLSDLSPGMVKAARRCLGCQARSIVFAVLDTAALPFAESTFDAVLAFGLLDHLLDSSQALSEVQRILRPEGLFYTSAGDQEHLQQIEKLIKPFLPEANYGGDPNRFGLQNGACCLAQFFGEVEQRLYENELIFKEPEPIAAYVLSEEEVRQRLSAAQLKAFQSHLKEKLASQGEIRVTIKKGVFSGKQK